jgi:phage pi2 protein 07
MKKKKLTVISIISFIVIVWLMVYFPNANLADVVDDREIKEELSYGDYKVIFSTDSEYIYGEVYKKGLFGWKLINSSSPAVSDLEHHIKEHIFRPSNISSISIENQGFLYGYVNKNAVESIRFQTDNLEYLLKVKDDFWFIPVDETNLEFKDEQLSVILKSGEEIYYPFEEIE